LPPITMPSMTEKLALQAGGRPAIGAGTMTVLAFTSVFIEDRLDAPALVGVGSRAAVVLRLTPARRSDLYELGEAIWDSGVVLSLQAHQVGRYGLLRAVLELPATRHGYFETCLPLSDGDVQEFVAAAGESGVVDLHIDHTTHDRILPYSCRAAGIGEVIDTALDALSDLDHPGTQGELAEARAGLRAMCPHPDAGWDWETTLRLHVIDITESHVNVNIDR